MPPQIIRNFHHSIDAQHWIHFGLDDKGNIWFRGFTPGWSFQKDNDWTRDPPPIKWTYDILRSVYKGLSVSSWSVY